MYSIQGKGRASRRWEAMKIVTVVGARPQLIKAAAVSNVLRQRHSEVLVHTGQHYDENMSDIFFDELSIPRPDKNLGIGSLSHGAQTGRMLEALEALYLEEKPDAVLVYGDTNSTLAAALAASKLLVPVAHVEAGLRSGNFAMPEEQNRILTDHLSTWLFTPTKTADDHLAGEGLRQGVMRTGDVMFDAVRMFSPRANQNAAAELFGVRGPYLLATLHRAENTNSRQRLSAILSAFGAAPRQVLLPLHPRTQKLLGQYGLSLPSNIRAIDPVGYLTMLGLEMGADMILTDSGGLQKEAFFLAKPCITLRDETEWVETVESGWNTVVGADKGRILDAMRQFQPSGTPPALFGTGRAAQAVSERLDAPL